MARGFVIGLFVSAALTLVICKLVDRGTAPVSAPAPAAAGPADVPAAGPDAAAEAARLKSENEAAQRKIADTQAAQAAAAAAAEKAARAKKPNPWTKIAKGLMAFLKRVKEDPKTSGQNEQDLFIEMVALMGKIAKERGVTLGDALLTPEGLPALIAGAFEDADPPLTDAERAALEKFAADVTAGWEALQNDKDSRTALEQRLEMLNNSLGASDVLSEGMSPEHAEMAKQLKAMGVGMMGGMGMSSHYASGTKEEIRDNFLKQWAKTLKFDESQAGALAPIVEEYIRTVDAATEKFQKDTVAGAMGGESGLIVARVQAQIAAQKKIESSFTLTKAQKKALDGWSTTYVYWGGMPAPAPTEDEPK